MLQRRTKATVGLLSLVLVTVGLVELAQAVQSSAPRFVVLPPDQLGAALVLDTTTSLRWQKTPGSEPVSWLTASSHCASLGGGSRLPDRNWSTDRSFPDRGHCRRIPTCPREC